LTSSREGATCDPAVLSSFCRRDGIWLREGVLRRIIQANIDRFKELLKIETDPTRRAMETRLLAEEEAKLKQLAAKTSDEKNAY
jgi:hypothetical protein